MFVKNCNPSLLDTTSHQRPSLLISIERVKLYWCCRHRSLGRKLGSSAYANHIKWQFDLPMILNYILVWCYIMPVSYTHLDVYKRQVIRHTRHTCLDQ